MVSILTAMKDEKRQFSLDELASLIELPRRTVRYYIQEGLIDRPEGAGRGAHYSLRHLEQLMAIRKWQRAGLSLERIRELLSDDADTLTPPPPRRGRGAVEVWSHIVLDEGIELTVEPSRAQLSPEELRELAQGVESLYDRIRKNKEQPS